MERHRLRPSQTPICSSWSMPTGRCSLSRANPPTTCSTAKAGLPAPVWEVRWTPTSHLPKQMSKVPENANFTSLKGFIPPPAGSAATFPVVYYSATPAEISRLWRPAAVDADSRHPTVVRVEHRQRRLQVHADRRLLLPDLGPLVHLHQTGARSVDVCHLQLACGFCEDPAGQPCRVRFWRRCRERPKPKTPC